MLGLSVMMFMWAVNSGVVYFIMIRSSDGDTSTIERMMVMFGTLALCMFGTAWLCSSASNSHSLSMAVGVLVPLTLALGGFGLFSLAGWPDRVLEDALPWVFAAIGVVSFLVGARYYVWRVEP